MTTNHAKLNGLSPTQVATLRAVDRGHLFRSERAGSLYRTFANPTGVAFNERTIDKLCDLDLIRIGEKDGSRRRWDITEAGRTALRLADQREQRRAHQPR